MSEKAVSAARPIIGGLTMHLKTAPGSLAPHCLMVGAAGRARTIAQEYLTGAVKVGGDDNRYYDCYTGEYRGLPISVVTHGIGMPSMLIAIEESRMSGAQRYLRIGSCSTLRRDINIGDVAIVAGALPPGATDIDGLVNADPRMYHALLEAADKIVKVPYAYGICVTTNDFTGGQGRPDAEGFLDEEDKLDHEARINGGEIDFYDMENYALFNRARTRRTARRAGFMAGSVMAVYGNRITDQLVEHAGDKETIETALQAMVLLAHDHPLP